MEVAESSPHLLFSDQAGKLGSNGLPSPRWEERVQEELRTNLNELATEFSRRAVKLCLDICTRRFSEALEDDRTAKVRAAATKGAELKAFDAARESAAILIASAVANSGAKKSTAINRAISALEPAATAQLESRLSNTVTGPLNLWPETERSESKESEKMGNKAAAQLKGKGKDGNTMGQQHAGVASRQMQGKGAGNVILMPRVAEGTQQDQGLWSQDTFKHGVHAAGSAIVRSATRDSVASDGSAGQGKGGKALKGSASVPVNDFSQARPLLFSSNSLPPDGTNRPQPQGVQQQGPKGKGKDKGKGKGKPPPEEKSVLEGLLDSFSFTF